MHGRRQTGCPFSEAQFQTLKYRPDFPNRFPTRAAARRFLRRFCVWYNTEHHHSGLGWVTPAAIHQGDVVAIQNRRV